MKNTETGAADSIVLMNRARIKRSINRMAYQIVEDNRDEQPIIIVGLKKRGYAVASQLSEQLSSLSNNEVALVKTDRINGKDVEKSVVILVDDVIFSGSTMLNALQAIYQNSKPDVIRVAVLVDRGHRKVPVEATFVGLDLPTKLDEHVHVEIENESPQQVLLTNASQ